MKKIKPSEWVHWEDLRPPKEPGIYIFAHLDKIPKGPTNLQTKDIIYIGETCRTLLDRWRQFKRAALSGKGSHSGGERYHKQFKKLRPDLFVATITITEKNRYLQNARIRFIERKLIYDYVMRWKKLPSCNQK